MAIHNNDKLGAWIVGVKGSIALTTILGTLAIRSGFKPEAGLVTATDIFDDLPLPGLSAIVFGGCDIRPHSLAEAVAEFHHDFQFLDHDHFLALTKMVAEIDVNVSRGTAINCGPAIEGLGGQPTLSGNQDIEREIEKIRQELRAFRDRNGLGTVVVVNLGSTEPPLALHPCHEDLTALRQKFAEGDVSILRASTLYAYAAIMEGCPYINFTPSNAALPPALIKLAEATGVPVMGNDGKTGETLVKSTLAPMFASRDLEILSWEGFNLLGNLDGKVLNDPDNCASKLKTKDQVLPKILGYTPHSRVHINYVPSLADQKTAWDFIHFKGFLGAKMSLQFTWQGYDSLLAAPLVLDLIRLAALAKSRGEAGLMPHLASFFKAPLGCNEYRHAAQFEMLCEYVKKARPSPTPALPKGSGNGTG